MLTWNRSVLVILFYLSVNSMTCEKNDKYVNFINPRGLSSLEWGNHSSNFGDGKSLADSAHIKLRGKRFVLLGNQDQKPNKPHQACIAPGNEKGFCRHLSKCVLEDFRTDFARFLDYICIIDQSYVGVCCPNKAEENVRNNSLTAENLARFLPAVANIDDDKPIWDEVEREKKNKSESNSSEDPTKTPVRIARAPNGCGMSSKSSTRIVGGRPADSREWPWMVALIRLDADQYCGGVLITDRHVLTAAHCVQRIRRDNVIVRLGEYDFSKREETRALDFHIADIKIHHDFDPANYDNDIAIIKIHRPTIFNSYIWPVCLPYVGLSVENKNAIVTGWGTQYYGGPASSILMEVPVPVWPQDKCQQTWSQKITDNIMCAGAYQGGRDSCQGDSGGPLLHQMNNGRWVSIGIVSWGIRCGEPGHPGIYTRVSSYLDWIFTNVVF